jgi:hypothetical protein
VVTWQANDPEATQTNGDDGGGGILTAAKLGRAIKPLGDKAVSISEGDSNASFISANFPAGKAITGGKLTSDAGSYVEMVVGRTRDGKLAGFSDVSVET